MEAKTKQAHAIEDQEVDDIVREHLEAFVRGDFDAWGNHFAPNVFFTAADPEEVFFDRDATVAEMHRDFDPAFDEGLQIEIELQSLHVGLASDCNAAWIAAPLRYFIRFQDETSSFVLRHTSLLSKTAHGWSILATHYSLVLPEPILLQARLTGCLPDPAPVDAVVGQGAQALVDEFAHDIADFSRSAIHRDAQAFGLLPGEHAEGESAVRALFAAQSHRWGALRTRPDGVRAAMLSKQAGWVSANVDVVVPYAGQQVTLPLRALVAYHKEEDHWSIAHAHLSVGIPDELAEA